MVDFVGFPKVPRLSRDIVVTEKLDGTNSQIYIPESISYTAVGVLVGSRNRWITPEDDNYGFCKWVYKNLDELVKLGPGHHFGEWWGQGIQRGYGLKEKRFSLFNTSRWRDNPDLPSCCHVVPVLYEGPFDTNAIDTELHMLTHTGSKAEIGYMNPEGIMIFHTAANRYFKKTILNDDKHKGEL